MRALKTKRSAESSSSKISTRIFYTLFGFCLHLFPFPFQQQLQRPPKLEGTSQETTSSGLPKKNTIYAQNYIYKPGKEGTNVLSNHTIPTIPTESYIYKPASAEQYIMDHMEEFGWHNDNNPVGCMIWQDPQHPLYKDLNIFQKELEVYHQAVRNFTHISVDLRELKRKAIENGKEADAVCDQVKLGPSGVEGFFSASHQLSQSSTTGFMEPLTTPMRHPGFCSNRNMLMDMNYMVHDFEALCRHKLHPTSRTILIDLGASLSYHDDQANKNPLLQVDQNPIEYLLELYEKFGIRFDHIYGFEAKFTEPTQVYQNLVPAKYMASYHWINAGIVSDPDGKLNPWHSVLRKYTEDDFIVVKLDIDTARIELPLAHQLLQDESLSKLVDQFYFEHHVHMKEMARIWRSAMAGTLKETFDLFSGLRQKGVPAHFWV